MKCENLQFNLSLYADNFLTDEERASADAHLLKCPLCRQRLADFQSLRNGLRGLARTEISAYRLNAIKSAVADELKTVEGKSSIPYSKAFRRWLMPYSVGAIASLLMTFGLLWALLSEVNQPSDEFARMDTNYKSTVMLPDQKLTSNRNLDFYMGEYDLKPEAFAAGRINVSGESPSVNPGGALIALTKSLVRGKMKDEEVTIVADVFSNGLARISEVVEPPHDEQTMRDLEKALRTDPDFAPFVPARLDRRADSVQIVLKIQRVDVIDSKSKASKK